MSRSSPPDEMLDKLFDTLDIVVESAQPLSTGDLALEESGAAVQTAHTALPRAPQAAPPTAPQAIRQAGPQIAPKAAPEQHLDAFFEAHDVYAQACRDLHEGAFERARGTLERLVAASPTTSEYLAAASYVRFKLASSDRLRNEEARKLSGVRDQYPCCVTTLTFLARMNLELNRTQTAVQYLKEAAELVPDRPEILMELRRANELLNQIRKGKEAAKPGERSGGQHELGDERPAWSGLSVAILLISAFFGAFVLGGLGRAERWWIAENVVVWARLAILLMLGLISARVFLRAHPLESSDFSVSIGGFIGALLVGVLAGALVPGTIIRAPLAIVAAMAVAQVLAEEAFFRVYLGRALHGIGARWRAPLIGGVLYGVYALTYYSIWYDGEPGDGPMRILSITALAGIPYALLHHRTRSVMPPLIAHLVANLSIVVSSTY